MKTDTYSFLGDLTNSELINFRKRLSRTAKEIEEYFTAGAPETNFLIASKDAEEWLTNLPPVLMHQIVTNKLSSRQVYGLERAHFEGKRPISKHIEKYVSRFSNADITANDYCYQILSRLSVTLQQAVEKGGRYHEMQELLDDSSLRMIVASVLFEVDGYNTFFGLNYEINILEMMEVMDSPVNLITKESVIPVRVFSDFVEIQLASELVINICDMKIGATGDPYYAQFSNDFDLDRSLLEEKLWLYTEKYPCLRGQQLRCLGKHLLHHYALDPLDMINRFGQEIMCCPFKIPEEFQLTEHEKEWKAANTWSDANKAKILF